jgi:hypothetical protein
VSEAITTSWLSARDANRILALVGCDHEPVIAGTVTFNQWLDHVLNHLVRRSFFARFRARSAFCSM